MQNNHSFKNNIFLAFLSSMLLFSALVLPLLTDSYYQYKWEFEKTETKIKIYDQYGIDVDDIRNDYKGKKPGNLFISFLASKDKNIKMLKNIQSDLRAKQSL